MRPDINKYALEVLSDPAACEADWMRALTALGGTIPRQRVPAKLTRFLRRIALLGFAYPIVCGATYSTWVYADPSYAFSCAVHSLPHFLLLSALEATTGFVTIGGAIAILQDIPSCASRGMLDLPVVDIALSLVILVNLFSYRRFRWRPYILRGIALAIRAIKQRSDAHSLRSTGGEQ